MHLVTNWPKGCLILLVLWMTCAIVSNGTVSLTRLEHAQDAHGCILTRAHGVRELMWLIIFIIICIIIIIISFFLFVENNCTKHGGMQCFNVECKRRSCLKCQPNLEK